MDYSGLPEHDREPMRMFVEHGILPGGFLTAVLENDLLAAVMRADLVNRAALADIVRWMNVKMPAGSFGSREAVSRYSEQRRR